MVAFYLSKDGPRIGLEPQWQCGQDVSSSWQQLLMTGFDKFERALLTIPTQRDTLYRINYLRVRARRYRYLHRTGTALGVQYSGTALDPTPRQSEHL